jgi:hypothetical protein
MVVCKPRYMLDLGIDIHGESEHVMDALAALPVCATAKEIDRCAACLKPVREWSVRRKGDMNLPATIAKSGDEIKQAHLTPA